MVVQRVDMHVCAMATPSDTSEIAALFEQGVDAASIVALIGKSEGTGLHDDFGRELADLSLRETIAAATGADRDEVADRVAIVLSGGSFGVVTPHVTVITKELLELEEPPSGAGLLAVGRSFSEPIQAEEVGRLGQIRKVAAAVSAARDEAQITEAADVHCVLVKAPSLSRESISEAEARGHDVVTYDLGVGESGAMCFANDGSALGVALALGEVAESALSDDAVRSNWDLYSEVASTSAGGEKQRAEVLLLGNSQAAVGALRIGHGITKDLIDPNGVKRAMRSAGLEFDCCPSEEDLARVVQVFAKLIIPGDGRVRGQRTTLIDDIESAKSTKCVGGALVASVLGRTTVYMSGGERNSHQGPPNGSPVAAVVRT